MLSALPIATTVTHDGLAFLRPRVSSVYDPVGHVSRSSGRLSRRSVGRRSSGRSVGARKSVCRRNSQRRARRHGAVSLAEFIIYALSV